MDQSIGQALSGFSVILFTAFMAVIVGAFIALITKGVILGTMRLNQLMSHHMPLTGKLMAGTIKREKKVKPGLVMPIKKTAAK